MAVKDFHNSTEQMLIYVAGVISEYDLTRDVGRDQLYKHITDLVGALETDTSEIIPYELAVEYFNGLDHANVLLGNNSTSFDSNGRLKSGISNQIHVEQLESLVMDTMMDLSAAYRTFEQNAVGSIDTAINQVRADMAISTLTGRNKTQLIKQVQKAFREQGQTAFITSDGKMLPLDFYAATVVETKLSQANVNGHLQRYDDADVDLVQVMARPGTCEHCAAHDGMVYSRGGSHPKYPEYPEDLIPLHPHCKCTLIPVIEDFLTDSERKAIDERVAKGVDFDPRTDAEKALYERDQRINRRNNAEKKLFMKMQAELGADMPVSLPAFRRMKRADTSKYQELYSNYLSATYTGKAVAQSATQFKPFDLIQFETKEQAEDPERIKKVVSRAKDLLKDYEATTGVNPVKLKQERALRDANNPYDDEHAKLTRYMMQQTGYDGLPKRMSADEKGFEIYRGVSNNDALNATGADMVERFRNGPVDISGGKSSASGRGMYFDQAIQGAQSYADDNEGGAIITAYILEDTKLMNKKAMSQELDFYRANENLFTDEEKAIYDLISGSNFMMDKNYEMYAMLHGYDGMDIGDGWYVMFNRSKLGVKD